MAVGTYADAVTSALDKPEHLPWINLPGLPHHVPEREKLRWKATVGHGTLTMALMYDTNVLASMVAEFPGVAPPEADTAKSVLKGMRDDICAWIELARKVQKELGIEVWVGHIERSGG